MHSLSWLCVCVCVCVYTYIYGFTHMTLSRYSTFESLTTTLPVRTSCPNSLWTTFISVADEYRSCRLSQEDKISQHFQSNESKFHLLCVLRSSLLTIHSSMLPLNIYPASRQRRRHREPRKIRNRETHIDGQRYRHRHTLKHEETQRHTETHR